MDCSRRRKGGAPQSGGGGTGRWENEGRENRDRSWHQPRPGEEGLRKELETWSTVIGGGADVGPGEGRFMRGNPAGGGGGEEKVLAGTGKRKTAGKSQGR